MRRSKEVVLEESFVVPVEDLCFYEDSTFVPFYLLQQINNLMQS